MIDLPYQKSPCSNCPFKKDTLQGWLGEDRATEIAKSDRFVCHKRNDLQCAGHMVVIPDNLFIGMAKLFRFEINILNQDKLFSTPEEFIENHKG